MSGTLLRYGSIRSHVVVISILFVLICLLQVIQGEAAVAKVKKTGATGVVKLQVTLAGRDVTLKASGFLMRSNGDMVQDGLVETPSGLEVHAPAGRYKLMVVYSGDPNTLVLPVEVEIEVVANQEKSVSVALQSMTLTGMTMPNANVPGAPPQMRPSETPGIPGGYGGLEIFGGLGFDISKVAREGFNNILSSLTDTVAAQPKDGHTRKEQKDLAGGKAVPLAEVGSLQVQPIEAMANTVVPYDKLIGSAAYKMATKLYKASTQAEVEQLLLQVLRQIGIGVYTQQGVQIQGGAERSAQDTYLYDIHVKSVAGHFLKRDSWEPSGYVRLLGSLGVPGINTERLTGPDLALIIASGWFDRDFTDINAPEHYLPLLFTSLGMIQSQQDRSSVTGALGQLSSLNSNSDDDESAADTLTDALDSGMEKWDPIQVLLLTLDLLSTPRNPLVDWQQYMAQRDGAHQYVATVFGNRPIQSGMLGQRIANGIPLPRMPWFLYEAKAEAAGRCDFSGDTKGAWGAAMASFQDKADKLGAAGGKANLAMAVTGAVQGTLLAWGFDFTLTTDKKAIHYIHGSEKKWVGLKVHVEYLDQWPDIVTECGWLVGMDLPKKGPLEGKEVVFEFDDGLLAHGRPGFSTRQETDAGGNAYMEYIPNKEDPIGSITRRVTGVVQATVNVQDWLNLPSKVGELLFPRDKFVAFTVSWHEPKDDEKPKPSGTKEERPFWNPFGW